MMKRTTKTRRAVNAILWSQKTLVKTEQSSWYDHTFYRVPVLGTVDLAKIKNALFDKLYRASHGKFGGGTSLGTVSDNGDGSVTVEVIYHIGD